MTRTGCARTTLIVLGLVTLVVHASAAAGGDLPAAEFKARRIEAMKRLPDGILLLHSKTAFLSIDQYAVDSFKQDPSFYYFAGLSSAVSAILALDGRTKEAWLFVPPKLTGFASGMPYVLVKPNAESESSLKIDHVKSWEEFAPYVDRRLVSDPKLVLYVEDYEDLWTVPRFSPSIPESNPPGLAPVDNRWLSWRHAVELRWPHAVVRSASAVVEQMRLLKSPGEIEVMRRLGKVTADAGLAALGRIAPRKTEREIDAEVNLACVRAGAVRASTAEVSERRVQDGLANYQPGIRTMRAGDVIDVDFGCEFDHYASDTTRTAPVSGHFDSGQREVWELFVRVYKAGLGAIKDGAHRDDVFAASLRQLEQEKSAVKTELGRKAVQALRNKDSRYFWLVHSSGIGCCETEPDTVRAGMIVVFEPWGLTVDGQSFGIEDMVLVKDDGYEILTPWPYSADEIERAVQAGSGGR